jgi:hypothetical protein
VHPEWKRRAGKSLDIKDRPVTDAMIRELNPQSDLPSLEPDLVEIGYRSAQQPRQAF